MTSNLLAMASNLLAMARNLLAILAMASALVVAMASNLIAMAFLGCGWTMDLGDGFRSVNFSSHRGRERHRGNAIVTSESIEPLLAMLTVIQLHSIQRFSFPT